MPQFSIVIPAYNAVTTLAETVASVRAQTSADWELVIVDDGSTDATLALAESLAQSDPRIRVTSQQNRGSGGAYNTAVANAHADLLVMLSADDLLLPDHLESFSEFIAEHPDASVFTCEGWYEDEAGTRTPTNAASRWSDPTRCTLEELLHACFFGVGATFRRPVFDAVGGFREDLYAEDYLFWLLALARGFEHRHLGRPLSVHRRLATQKSSDAVRMRRTDVRVIEEVIASGLLSPSQVDVAQSVIAQLERNIRIRTMAARLLGSERAEALVTRARRWRSS